MDTFSPTVAERATAASAAICGGVATAAIARDSPWSPRRAAARPEPTIRVGWETLCEPTSSSIFEARVVTDSVVVSRPSTAALSAASATRPLNACEGVRSVRARLDRAWKRSFRATKSVSLRTSTRHPSVRLGLTRKATKPSLAERSAIFAARDRPFFRSHSKASSSDAVAATAFLQSPIGAPDANRNCLINAIAGVDIVA